MVLQSGRFLHLRSWWLHFRYGNQLEEHLRARLIIDTRWWINVTRTWEEELLTGIEYPILCADELLATPKAIYIVQSDCSGTDGFGYFHGYLGDEEMDFTAIAWSATAVEGSGWHNDPLQYTTSHDGELKALDHFLRNTKILKVMLIWITDSLSGVFSVNKGRCKEALGLITLTSILEQCDEKNILIVALWVPRELNQYADYLSHLAVYLNRSEVKGRTRAAADHGAAAGVESCRKEKQ